MPFEGDNSFQSFAVPDLDLWMRAVFCRRHQYILWFGYANYLLLMAQIMSLFSRHPVIQNNHFPYIVYNLFPFHLYKLLRIFESNTIDPTGLRDYFMYFGIELLLFFLLQWFEEFGGICYERLLLAIYSFCDWFRRNHIIRKSEIDPSLNDSAIIFLVGEVDKFKKLLNSRRSTCPSQYLTDVDPIISFFELLLDKILYRDLLMINAIDFSNDVAGSHHHKLDIRSA